MFKKLFLIYFLLGGIQVQAQNKATLLKDAVLNLQQKSTMAGGILSIAVQDAKTGEWIYRHQSSIGLPAASTQKIITAAAAYQLLGKDFQYKTRLYHTGEIVDNILKGDIHILSSGDPSFGSWRWTYSHRDSVLNNIITVLKNLGIQKVNGKIHLHQTVFDVQSTPGGYTYQDMGNYYGAGSWSLNWNENQYDLLIDPGKKIGDTTLVLQTNPSLSVSHFYNGITTAAAGTGDKSYIYITPYAQWGFATGTLPIGKTYTVSGSMPYPAQVFAQALELELAKNGIEIQQAMETYPLQKYLIDKTGWKEFYSISSPKLSELSYWFLRKSINLYGEVFIKTIGAQKMEYASLDSGLSIVKNFWVANGIPMHQIKMMDGSGLSPENRITAEALLKVLQYARKQSWYESYIDGFPLYNNMKLKSGTISGVKAFAGVHRSKDGKDYNIAIIAYNYNGTSNNIVQEMYKILNILK